MRLPHPSRTKAMTYLHAHVNCVTCCSIPVLEVVVVPSFRHAARARGTTGRGHSWGMKMAKLFSAYFHGLICKWDVLNVTTIHSEDPTPVRRPRVFFEISAHGQVFVHLNSRVCVAAAACSVGLGDTQAAQINRLNSSRSHRLSHIAAHIAHIAHTDRLRLGLLWWSGSVWNACLRTSRGMWCL